MEKPLTLSPLIEASVDELTDELTRRSSVIMLGFITHEKFGTGHMDWIFKGPPEVCRQVTNTVALHMEEAALRKTKE